MRRIAYLILSAFIFASCNNADKKAVVGQAPFKNLTTDTTKFYPGKISGNWSICSINNKQITYVANVCTFVDISPDGKAMVKIPSGHVDTILWKMAGDTLAVTFNNKAADHFPFKEARYKMKLTHKKQGEVELRLSKTDENYALVLTR